MITKMLRWMGYVPTLLFAVGFAFAGYWLGTQGNASGSGTTSAEPAAPSGGPGTDDQDATEYVCPMHPQIRQDEFGTCPICFMDLVPVETDYGGDDGDVPTLRLSASAASLADVRTAPVERRPLSRDIAVLGRVGVASSGDARITAWTAGRIERLYVTSVGETVRRGQR
ncbi:MAG: Cu(I)/Ag(I) efflux system membrane fusion protein, partial [Bradymonadia bacterium]